MPTTPDPQLAPRLQERLGPTNPNVGRSRRDHRWPRRRPWTGSPRGGVEHGETGVPTPVWAMLALAMLSACASARPGGVEFARKPATGTPAGCPDAPITYDLGHSGLVGGDALRCSFEDVGAAAALRVAGVVLSESADGGVAAPVPGVWVELVGAARKRGSAQSKTPPTTRVQVDSQGRFEITSRRHRLPAELRAIEAGTGRIMARARISESDIVREFEDDSETATGRPERSWEVVRVRLVVPAQGQGSLKPET